MLLFSVLTVRLDFGLVAAMREGGLCDDDFVE